MPTHGFPWLQGHQPYEWQGQKTLQVKDMYVFAAVAIQPQESMLFQLREQEANTKQCRQVPFP